MDNEVLFAMEVEVIDNAGKTSIYKCVNGRCRKLANYYAN